MIVKTIIFDFDGTLVHLNIDFDIIRREVENLLIDYGVSPGNLYPMAKGTVSALECFLNNSCAMRKEDREMKINCSACRRELILNHPVFMEYTGPVKCFFCGAVMDVEIIEGLLQSDPRSRISVIENSPTVSVRNIGEQEV
jgi:ribosomal protein S27E